MLLHVEIRATVVNNWGKFRPFTPVKIGGGMGEMSDSIYISQSSLLPMWF